MATTLPIPSDFVCSYDGIVLDPATALTKALTVTPVEDDTGRTVAFNKIFLHVYFEVHGSPTDAAVLALRQRLTKYGKALVYDGRGVGPLRINTGRIRDIRWGPKPKVLSIKPLGYKYAVGIDWEVEVHVPECPDARYSLGFLSLAYKMEFHLRRDGRVDRHVSGQLKIPNNRPHPRSTDVLDSPDSYRAKICPPTPYWHKRTFQPWRTDESRTTLDFGWVDEEFGENCLPAGVVDMKASQDVEPVSSGGVLADANGLMLQTTIRAEIAWDARHDYRVAERAFWALVRQRIGERKRAGVTAPDPRGVPRRVSYLPMWYAVRQPDIVGKEGSGTFSVVYQVLGTRLEDLIAHTGLFQKLENDWAGWYRSVQTSSQSPYGYSGYTFAPESDQIVDLCGGTPEGLKPVGAARRVTQPRQLGGIAWPEVEEIGSWLRYHVYISIETDTGTVPVRPLAQKSPTAAPPTSTPAELKGGTLQPRETAPAPRPVASDPKGYESLAGTIAEKVGRVPAFGRSAGGTSPGAGRGKGNPPPDGAVQGKAMPGPEEVAVQRRTPPGTVIYLCGSALRVGFEVPVPSLGEVNGLTPVPANRIGMGEHFTPWIGGYSMTGVPLYAAMWRLRYILTAQPAGPVLPPDPASWLGRRLG